MIFMWCLIIVLSIIFGFLYFHGVGLMSFFKTLKAMILRNKPYLAQLFATKRCNLKCRIWSIWRKPSTKEMDTEEMFKIIDRLKKMGVSILSLTGGEPLLREEGLKR